MTTTIFDKYYSIGFNPAGDKLLTRCLIPECGGSFLMDRDVVYNIAHLSREEAWVRLHDTPKSLCPDCRQKHGTYHLWARARDRAFTAQKLEERDGISPMVGAE